MRIASKIWTMVIKFIESCHLKRNILRWSGAQWAEEILPLALCFLCSVRSSIFYARGRTEAFHTDTQRGCVRVERFAYFSKGSANRLGVSISSHSQSTYRIHKPSMNGSSFTPYLRLSSASAASPFDSEVLLQFRVPTGNLVSASRADRS